MKVQYLECAKIINTHGTKGAIKLENRCDTPKILSSLRRIYLKNGTEYEERQVRCASVFKEFVIMEIEGISDMDTAMLHKNRLLYAKREDIPLAKGSFFIADLEGLLVIDNDNGKVYGKLKEVLNRGASDIYVIDTPTGEKMIPAVKEFVREIDLEKGIFISPIDGMFDDE
ncbi:MAG: 16S rRNA processing protein RimM [Clostridia bacterium]|nr:16S rRNA processing protein RimM [Clostridia bacterium]